jgi:LysR family glycine cleavage system transcriptional activator
LPLRLALSGAASAQIAVRLLTSLAVVNLQQEGIDLAIRMGQGDWEGWKAGICLPMNSWWWPRRLSRRRPADHPQAIAASDIIFHGVLNAWCSQGGRKADRRGLRLNDSNLVLEAVRLGAGVALERRLVAGR